MALTIVVPFVNVGNEVLNDMDDCEVIAVLTAVAFDFPAMIIDGN